PDLQIRQCRSLERARQLERHQEIRRLADAIREIVLEIDDRGPARPGGDRNVMKAEIPCLVDCQRASKTDTAVNAKRMAARQGQMKQRQKILIPTNPDSVFGNAATTFENALLERLIDLRP